MESITFKNVAGIILLPARADGVEGWFAFDTGAMQTTVNSAYFSYLAGEAKEIAVFNEKMAVNAASEATLRELTFGPFTVNNLSVICMDAAYVENSLRIFEPELRLLGSIGMEALGDVPVLLDYQKSVLTVAPDISTDGAEKLPLSREALPVISLTVSGEAHRFVLDTGANTCLLSNDLADTVAATPLPDSPGVYVLPEIAAGTRKYRNINAVFTDISQIRERVPVDGVIGSQILSEHLSLLDFPHAALWLF